MSIYQQYKEFKGVSSQQKTREVLKDKVDTGTLEKVFNVLRTGEFAVGGLLAGKSPITGIKERISVSDSLGITNSFGRLVADVFLDPTTYITLGTGGGVKIATKAGKEIALTKFGTKEFQQMSKRIGFNEAKKEFAEVVARNPSYIDKSGIKFMGQTIVPKTAFDNFAKFSKDNLYKVPYVNSAGKKVEEIIEVFNPMIKLKKNPELAEFVQKYNLFIKGTRAKQMDAIELTAKMEKEMVKKHGKDFGNTLTKYIENTASIKKVPESMVDDITQMGNKIIKMQEGIANNEFLRGILKSTLGQTAFKALPKNLKPIVEKYTDDILMGTIKTVEDFKRVLSKSEKALMKGKFTPAKIFNSVINSSPNVDNYMRHVLTDKGRNFLNKEGSLYNALPKPLRVKLQANKTRGLRYTIDEINEAMRSKVGGDFFEPDAFKSLAYRQVESVRAVETYDFLEGIKKSYGVQAISGEPSRLIDGVKYIKSTNKQLDGLVFPEPIVRQIDETINFLTGDKATKEFLKVYDNMLNFWKGSVTGWFPAFHTRNFIGGAFNNWLAKMNPKYYSQAIELQNDLKKGGNKIWVTANGESYTSNQLIKVIKESGSINQPGMIDVMKEVEDVVGATTMKKIGNYPKVLLEAVENNLRVPLFMDRFLGRGYSVADSAKDIFKYHFDYAPEGLTAFERNVMKRVIPFYTWTRNNIPLQMEEMIKQPGKYAFFPKLQSDIGGKVGEEELQDLPEWMRDMMVVRVGEQGGNALWLQLNLPLEDISKLPVNSKGVKDLMSMMSPILKVPTELLTNRDLFWGTDIVNPDLPKEFQTSKVIKQLNLLPEPIKDFLNFKKVQKKVTKGGVTQWEERYEMDGIKLHILKGAVGRFYSTVGQIFEEDKSATNKILRLVGGMPAREINIEDEKYWRTYEKEKEERAIKMYEGSRIFEE